MTYTPMAQRVLCPSCGAALELRDDAALVTCPFCQTRSRIVRALRREEPRFSWELTAPRKEPEPENPPESWGFEALLYTLNSSRDRELQLRVAKAMDSWTRVREDNLKWLPALLHSLPHFEEELCHRAAGIVGKFLCSRDQPKLRGAVLDMLPEFIFLPKGNVGIARAASLANAATVRLLLDTARHACREGNEDYAKVALSAVQTAIGREREERKVAVCILIHHLFEVEPLVSDWILRHLRHHFDVGYTDIVGETLEVYDDALEERPDLADGLEKALARCRRPRDHDDLALRLGAYCYLKNPRARESALKLVQPTYPLSQPDIDLVMEVLSLQAKESLVAQVLSKFVWECRTIRPEHLANLESQQPLPQSLERALENFRQKAKSP